jgi:hypothetical protein
MNLIPKKKEPKFLDIRAKLFQNKSNGQLSISLPKKQLRKMVDFGSEEIPGEMPDKIPIRIFKWRNK